jgi:hypothetical protein
LPQKCHKLFRGIFCKLLKNWWAQQDSNLRLPPCEGGTLPLSYAPGSAPGALAASGTTVPIQHIIGTGCCRQIAAGFHGGRFGE